MNVAELRTKLPVTRNYNFMNHASIAPLSGPAAEAMCGFANEVAQAAYLKGAYYRAADRVRTTAAELIGAEPGELTFCMNTTHGIGLVANGIPWMKGDNIVSCTMEFPANVYPWLGLERRGVTLRRVADEDGRIPFDRLVEAVDRRTRLMAVSAVQWSNGFRFDLARLGEFCQEKGVLLLVDAIQALGVHPIDVRQMNIDFLSAGGHKWLLSPEGTGVFYCKRELIGHIKPATVGYMSVRHGYEHDAGTLRDEDLYDDARRFDMGVYNLGGISALGASLDFLREVGINEIQVRVKQLTDMLVEGVRSKGWKVHSPRTATEWSGIVAFSSDKHDMDELRRHLRREYRIVLATRLGKLRASPHFYNSTEEIEQVIDALPSHS